MLTGEAVVGVWVELATDEIWVELLTIETVVGVLDELATDKKIVVAWVEMLT